MTILADEKMLVRLDIYKDMLNIVQTMNTTADNQTLTQIEDTTHKINNLLHQVAIPFGRAGDKYYYAEAMKGWSTLHTRMMDLIQAAKTLNEKWQGSKSEKNEMEQKVFHFFTTIYLRYALLIAEISWYDDDVRPSWSTVVMNPTPVAQPRGQSSYQQPRDFNQETGGEKHG
jgi:phage pi2 protein 07